MLAESTGAKISPARAKLAVPSSSQVIAATAKGATAVSSVGGLRCFLVLFTAFAPKSCITACSSESRDVKNLLRRCEFRVALHCWVIPGDFVVSRHSSRDSRAKTAASLMKQSLSLSMNSTS